MQAQVQQILEKYEISSAAYHGGDLNGVSARTDGAEVCIPKQIRTMANLPTQPGPNPLQAKHHQDFHAFYQDLTWILAMAIISASWNTLIPKLTKHFLM